MGMQDRGTAVAMGQGGRLGHSARSGDGAGIGQGSSYRSFVSCRSGKLRFHRGSKRERDINTRLSARPAETRGAAGRELVPSISPHCHEAGMCRGQRLGGPCHLGEPGTLCQASGPGMRPGLGICPSQDPTRSTPCPAWSHDRAQVPTGCGNRSGSPRLPDHVSTLHPCSLHAASALAAHRPSAHTDRPTRTVLGTIHSPCHGHTDSRPLSPELPHGVPSPLQHLHIPELRRAPQPGAGHPPPTPTSAPAGQSWGCWDTRTRCVHVQAPSLCASPTPLVATAAGYGCAPQHGPGQ